MNSPTPAIAPSLPRPSISPDAAPAQTPVQAPAQTPWWGRIDSLWLAMAPLCALLFALALPLAPNDLWYHVRAGELLSRGALPDQNLMSNGVALAKPYFYGSWLAEWVLFQTLRGGGLSGLMLLRAFCVSGAVGCAVLAAWRRISRLPAAPSGLVAARWSAFAGILGFALSSNNVDLRPQTFSMLFFGCWLVATEAFRAQSQSQSPNRRQNWWGASIVLLMAVWANTHGAFVVGLLGLAVLALGDSVSRRPSAQKSWALLGLSLLAAVFNPHGLGLFAYVARMSSDPISQRFVQEWKSPGLDDWHSVLFWLMALGVGTAMALSAMAPSVMALSTRAARSKNQDVGENLMLALFFVMAARDQRAILWFALASVPFWATLGARIGNGSPTSAPPVPRAAQVLNAILLLFLLGSPLALFPGVKAAWPWPPEFRRRFAPTPASLFPGDAPLLLENTTPVAAAQWLRAHPPRGLLFTDMVCGSFLTYATAPNIKPWCDPRIELFSVPFWEDYLRLSSGPSDAARELEARGFSDALLDRQSQPGLVKRLQLSPRWRIVARNGPTVLFQRIAA